MTPITSVGRLKYENGWLGASIAGSTIWAPAVVESSRSNSSARRVFHMRGRLVAAEPGCQTHSESPSEVTTITDASEVRAQTIGRGSYADPYHGFARARRVRNYGSDVVLCGSRRTAYAACRNGNDG